MQMPKDASSPPASQCKMQPKAWHLASQCVKDAPFGGSRGRVTTKPRRLLLTAGVKIKYVRVQLE
eukprot:7345271-Prymnesium_polylepis.1